MRKWQTFLAAMLGALGILFLVPGTASAHSQSTPGGVHFWNIQYPWLGQNPTVYMVDETPSWSPVNRLAAEVDSQTNARIDYRQSGVDPYNCSPALDSHIRCAFIKAANLGATGRRVTVTGANENAEQRWNIVIVTINTYYARDQRIAASEACQAVARAMGLATYLRTGTNTGCMSNAMVSDDLLNTDKDYINRIHPVGGFADQF